MCDEPAHGRRFEHIDNNSMIQFFEPMRTVVGMECRDVGWLDAMRHMDQANVIFVDNHAGRAFMDDYWDVSLWGGHGTSARGLWVFAE